MMIENKIIGPLACKSNKVAKLTDRLANYIFKSYFKFETQNASFSLFCSTQTHTHRTNSIWVIHNYLACWFLQRNQYIFQFIYFFFYCWPCLINFIVFEFFVFCKFYYVSHVFSLVLEHGMGSSIFKRLLIPVCDNDGNLCTSILSVRNRIYIYFSACQFKMNEQ